MEFEKLKFIEHCLNCKHHDFTAFTDRGTILECWINCPSDSSDSLEYSDFCCRCYNCEYRDKCKKETQKEKALASVAV